MTSLSCDVAVAGGGAAGVFAAIACAEAAAGRPVFVLEKSPQFLAKVRISGGGRCNVTHSGADWREFASHYPRGGSALLGPLNAFTPEDTREWFAARGVALKTEPDGRVFPVSDSSRTIVDCLLHAARAAGVRLVPNCGLKRATPLPGGGFDLALTAAPAAGEPAALRCRALLLATGGCRGSEAGQVPVSLGHELVPPVPSLFTFHVVTPGGWLRELAGIAVPAQVAATGTGLRETGPVLVTHEGLSGPAILRLSAWGAREFHRREYRFEVRVNWLPGSGAEAVAQGLAQQRRLHPARAVAAAPPGSLPGRLWEKLALASGLPRQTRWADLSNAALHRLSLQLTGTALQVVGKSVNRDEFVTCGGVDLGGVNFRTMESRVRPGLYFAGELLDIDGLTGGYNFQAAWSTGWVAGRAMAGGS